MKIAQILTADSWGEITPEAFERGIGGREGALMRLAKEWAKLGHEVTNFVPVKRATRINELWAGNLSSRGITGYTINEPEGFHEYVPLSLAQPALSTWPYDAVIAWECPAIYDNEHILEKQKARLTHMQVAHFSPGQMEAAERYSTGVVALSKWAKGFLVSSGLVMDEKRLYVRPNGVDMSNYTELVAKNLDEPKFVYSSSPDRGLSHLLDMWPDIMERWPKATLYVAYGAKNFADEVKWSHFRIGEMSLKILEGLKQPGVIDLGKIGQDQLGELQRNATAWLYPADTIQATETGCITAIENMAAGNPCFMTDADCLESEFSDVSFVIPLPFHADRWLYLLETLLRNEPLYRSMAMDGRDFAKTRDWKVIAPTWLDLFEENKSLS
jgi:hypothetical protein